MLEKENSPVLILTNEQLNALRALLRFCSETLRIPYAQIFSEAGVSEHQSKLRNFLYKGTIPRASNWVLRALRSEVLRRLEGHSLGLGPEIQEALELLSEKKAVDEKLPNIKPSNPFFNLFEIGEDELDAGARLLEGDYICLRSSRYGGNIVQSHVKIFCQNRGSISFVEKRILKPAKPLTEEGYVLPSDTGYYLISTPKYGMRSLKLTNIREPEHSNFEHLCGLSITPQIHGNPAFCAKIVLIRSTEEEVSKLKFGSFPENDIPDKYQKYLSLTENKIENLGGLVMEIE